MLTNNILKAIETNQKIMTLYKKYGDVFDLAVHTLFVYGTQNINEEKIAALKQKILLNSQSNIEETKAFLDTYDCILELSKFSVPQILLFAKLYLQMDNDNLAALKAPERTLENWNASATPQEWRDAIANPGSRFDILCMMHHNHQDEYSYGEIAAAIRAIVEGDR